MRGIFEIAPADWSRIHEIFSEHGCAGTIEECSPCAMSGYLYEDAQALCVCATLSSRLLDAGASEVTVERVEEKNWAEVWKNFFKPRKVGKRLLIKPSWEGANDSESLVIELDPGQAFGTGEHPTTRLCLELLEEILCAGDTVADVGCGSGILSVAANLLGAGKIYATESDPASAEAARQNFQLNNVHAQIQCTADIPAEFPECDVVVSNIISAVLIRLAGQIARIVKPGTWWILSGVIADNWPDVKIAAEKAGFSLVDLREEDGWLAARLQKIM